MIPVTKPYIPSRKIFDQYIDNIFETRILSNNGPLLQELTERLRNFLDVENILIVNNGTVAIELAIKALGITPGAEVITTPFTYVSTSSAIKISGMTPVYGEIEFNEWCLDPDRVPELVNTQTEAIIPVHVFGNICQVDEFDRLAEMHGLKIIYDASHSFNTSYNGRNILNYGDASTISFHATKLFHTAEGGAIIFKNKKHLEYAEQLIQMGYDSAKSISCVGTNAKMAEINAALGLSVLDDFDIIKKDREQSWEYYKNNLADKFSLQKLREGLNYNHAYFPILFNTEQDLIKAMGALHSHNIQARRYFYPCLNSTEVYANEHDTEISDCISKRILCLPLYHGLETTDIDLIIRILHQATHR